MKKYFCMFLLCGVLAAWQSTAQFSEHFETQIPQEWVVIDNDGQGTTWQHTANEGYQGGGGVRITYENAAHDDYLITPQFTVLPGVTDLVSFYAGGTGPAFPETFDVKLSTSGTQPSDFTVLLGSETTIADVDDLGAYVEYTYNLSDYTGQAVHIAIVATTVAEFKLYVDEFTVTALPSCPKPTHITATSIMAESVALQWDAGNTETNWEVRYGSLGFDPERDGVSQNVSTQSATTLTDLTPNTVYDIYVKAICTPGTDESEWAGPLQLSTPCLPAQAPFEEGFETGYTDGTPVDGCWTQELISNTYWQANSSITANNRAPRTGDWNIYLAYGSETWMFYPVTVTSGVNYTFTLYARQSNTSGAELAVNYGMANTALDMTETVIPPTPITQGDYQEVTGTFTPTASGPMYIGIKGKVNGGFFPFYMAVDDISLLETPLCTKPADLEVGDATATTANISWTPGDTESQWLVKYGEPGFDPMVEGSALPVADNPTAMLTDLIPAHIYNVYVQAQCGGADGTSTFTGPLTVKTRPVNDQLCDATVLQVDEGCTMGSFSNVGATVERDEPQGSCFDAPGDQTVWFAFEAPLSGNVTVTTDFEGGTLVDSELAVYEAPANCTDFTTLGAEIGCDEDGGTTGNGFLSTVSLVDLVPGAMYYVQVNGFISFDDGTYEGTFCIEVQDDGPSCAAPTDVVVTTITPTTADVSWTQGDRESEWEIVYGPTGFDPSSSGTFMVDTDGIIGETLTNLQPNTTYDVYVRAICNPIDESFLSEVATFTTLLAPPVNDDLCNALSLAVDQACSGNTYTNRGATAQRDEVQGSCLPPIPNATVWFTFTAPASGNVSVTTNLLPSDLQDTELTIYEAPTDCMDLTTLGSVLGCNDDVDASNGEFLSTVELTGLTEGTTYYVQVNGKAGAEGDFCIEVRDTGVACSIPSDVSVETITTTSAAIMWQVNGSETAWEVTYGPTGFNPDTEGLYVVDTDGEVGITLHDLTPNTPYDVYVRALCSGNAESDMAGPATFTTTELTVATHHFDHFSLYPNPVAHTLMLSAQNAIDHVVVYNVVGQALLEATPGHSQVHLNTELLPQGVYLMNVTIDGYTKPFRFVKE